MFVKKDYFRQADYFHPYIFLGVPQAILRIPIFLLKIDAARKSESWARADLILFPEIMNFRLILQRRAENRSYL